MSSKTNRREAVAPALPQPQAGRCPWPAPPPNPALRPGETHLWCAEPGAFHQHLSRFNGLISEAEQDRAARFHSAGHRDAYIIRHGVLRLLLGQYLRQAPAEIEFLHGSRGKPVIPAAASELHFNESHSGDLALFAFTTVCPIGVDIERIRPIPDFERIATHYFSAQEVHMMRELPPDQRMKAFYACWTGKEAYLKATGEGIGAGLDKVEITLDQNLEAAGLTVSEDSHAAWRLHPFSPAPGYLGAVALTGTITALSLWRFPAY